MKKRLNCFDLAKKKIKFLYIFIEIYTNIKKYNQRENQKLIIIKQDIKIILNKVVQLISKNNKFQESISINYS